MTPGFAEIHLAFDVSPDQIEKFMNDSSKLGYKGIVADSVNAEQHIYQCMSGLVVHLTNSRWPLDQALIQMSLRYRELGWNSVREKIEVQPMLEPNSSELPNCLAIFKETQFPTLYWEQHIKVVLPVNECHRDLANALTTGGVMLSKSRFGRNTDPSVSKEMITVRGHHMTALQQGVNHVHSTLRSFNVDWEEDRLERVIYDTNRGYDNAWVSLQQQQFVHNHQHMLV